jgi:hypothetical protein
MELTAYLLSLNVDANIAHQWDFQMLRDIFDSLKLRRLGVLSLPKRDVAIVVIPARHHAGLEKQINKELNKIKRCIFFVMGDEEAEFDLSKIKHKNIEIWVQNPHMDKHNKYHKLGTGYPPHFKEQLKKIKEYPNKQTHVFFSGQNTHQRRHELIDVLKEMKKDNKNVDYVETKGFTQGLDSETYTKKMSETIIAPAPSGAVIPDSFRLFEALEAMAVPIADEKTPKGEVMPYWDWLFEEISPMPRVDDWNVLKSLYHEILENYNEIIQIQTSWYLLYKRKLKNKLKEQING